MFNIQKYDAEFDFKEAMKSTKNFQSLLWDVIVENRPCGRGKKFENFKEGLDLLVDHFDLK